MSNARKLAKPASRRNVATLIAIVGLIPLAFGLYGLARGYATYSWPTAEAVVTDGKLSIAQTKERMGSGKSYTDEAATFSVVFRYSVGGVQYDATGTERGDLGLQNSAGAEAMSDTYQIGAKTTVVYNPGNPAEAYLFRGFSSAAKMFTGFGAVMLLLSLWIRWIINKKITPAGRRRSKVGSEA